MTRQQRTVLQVTAVGAAAATCVGGFWLVVGSALNGCCAGMYGDPGNPCRAPAGKPISHAEEERIRQGWIAGAQEAAARCRVRVDAMIAGAVFVAAGERSPRAKELVAHECGTFNEDQLAHFKDPVVPPPLRWTNPALCDRLAAGALPEGLALRQDGGTLYFYYFTYEDVGGRLVVRDVYTKLAMDPGSLYFGNPPRMSSACRLAPTEDGRDEGIAFLYRPHGFHCFEDLTLESEDPSTAKIRLVMNIIHFAERTRSWRCRMADDQAENKSKFEQPPTALVQRQAKIQIGVTNTLRFPGDLQRDDPGPWFGGSTHAPTEKNDIRFLVDGQTAFATMFQAINATHGADDYVLMLNWFADPFLTALGFGTLGQLLAEKLQTGVRVRGLFWRVFANYAPWPLHSSQNEDMVNFLNRGWVERDGERIQYLPDGTPKHSQRNGAAIYDARLNRISQRGEAQFISVGSHHQKVLCVKAGGSLTTFVGGVDFNPDRVQAEGGSSGSPLHDVHCRVVGPASANLVRTFVDRWTDHPDGAQLDTETGDRVASLVTAEDKDTSQQTGTGRHTLQMGRTFGAGPLLHGEGGQGRSEVHYAFAPSGEQTARALISNAIRNAKKFIYLEDQYFVNLEAAQLLANALSNGLAHLTIVVPHHILSDLPLTVRHRRACIEILRQADPSHQRVRIFHRSMNGKAPQKTDWHTYVHSKMTIIDDEFAVVGTVNYNRRSWQYDSEINFGIYDPSRDRILTNRFAHWLRMRMWAEHLFGTVHPPSPPDGGVESWDCHFAEMFDPIAAGAQWVELIELEKKWLSANPGKSTVDYDQSQYNSVAQVRPYNVNEPPREIDLPGMGIPVLGLPLDLLVSTYGWDHFLDPGNT